ncbi:MAG: PhoH family protein [Pirellulaceae bacterium]
MTLCRGPTGCGKTYLAVALAVEALKSHLQSKKLCWFARLSKLERASVFSLEICKLN